MPALSNDERLKRWCLVLGKEAEDSGGAAGAGLGLPCGLDGDEAQMDKVLEALYDSDRKAGLGSSCPNVNRMTRWTCCSARSLGAAPISTAR